jgi:hypothetical protein
VGTHVSRREFPRKFLINQMALNPKSSRGGRRPGAGAPSGARNGRFVDGRYSRVLTPKERQAAWRAHWQRKRAERTETAAIPYISDQLQEFWE